MSVGGNHEVGSSEAWQSYNVRYPMPWRASGSSSNLFWSRAVGPVHLVGLNSYAATANSSAQFTWLQKDLAKLNRTATPWLVVMMHAPWYNSNTGHWGEAALMQADMEELLYTAGVDLVLAGHVHSYERTHPVYKGKLDECGPTYITIGDGGNREGAYVPWREPQPTWSAFREAAFGVGKVDVVNATHAEFLWTRHACEGSEDPYHMNFNKTCSTIDDNSVTASVPSDSITLRSHGARCPSSPASTSNSRPSLRVWWIISGVAAGLAASLLTALVITRWLRKHRAPQGQDYVGVDIE
ncbi:hypothetical protein CYMTET_53295 [Cymbomonas tetramitiformis]|uniref:Acid phosphatase n=1 Tax=Cymbomonas tetramitiformis TaxID=36881 RepID=A0AAE0EQH7_9CHLO|nr:hypothetical protein CYMTET_53295 [Cymbomonas tetramitiformis]